jgi:hypothetical protein
MAARLQGRRQETYDVIEISLIIDAGEPGLIKGARMRERDGSDEQKAEQHTQGSGTRGVQAVKNNHSRLVRGRSVLVARATTMRSKNSGVKMVLNCLRGSKPQWGRRDAGSAV